ncbi:MAG TPA: phage antirepressor [Pedomonas sp.]|uniref:phage antirepressor n=1 Tax=Pedomonas sp. TaxID=2976421 RepID=UPI002F422CBE
MGSTSLVSFAFDATDVRVTSRDGEPWFVLADVCRVLGISNPSDAASRLKERERHTLGNTEGIADSRVQSLVVISESGLYKLVLRSRKPEAERFADWITEDVIPSIRKTGSYGAAQVNLRDPAQLANIAVQLIEVNKELQDRAARAERLVEAAKPKTDFYDRFVSAEGLYGLQNVGRILGYGANRFVAYLKQGYMFYQGSALLPKARYRALGLFEVKSTLVEDKARLRSYMTPKGVLYFAKQLGITPSEDMLSGALEMNEGDDVQGRGTYAEANRGLVRRY